MDPQEINGIFHAGRIPNGTSIQQSFSVNPITNLPISTNFLPAASGGGSLAWQDVFTNISAQSEVQQAGIGQLPSTIYMLSNSFSSFSTIIQESYSSLSTMIGIGGIPGSVTGPQLTSSMSWVLNSSFQVSTADLVSTVDSFLSGNQSFASNIQSTVIGLGSSDYVSTLSLVSTTTQLEAARVSTFVGLGTGGYVSTASLTSTTRGLGTAGQVSTATLLSSFQGALYPAGSGGSLGLIAFSDPGVGSPIPQFPVVASNYLSTQHQFNDANAGDFGVVQGTDLPSTTDGLISSLGSRGQVSTLTLQSTSAGIQAAKQNVFITNLGNAIIQNSDVQISTVNAIVFLSSFVNSTMTYSGQNGLVGTSDGSQNLQWSSLNLNLDRFSSQIVSSTQVLVDFYPNFLFSEVNQQSPPRTYIGPMSTLVQQGSSQLSTQHQGWIFANSFTTQQSNAQQTPLRLQLRGSEIVGKQANPQVLSHYISSGVTYASYPGFVNSNLRMQNASTNSYFLSIQNFSFVPI